MNKQGLIGRDTTIGLSYANAWFLGIVFLIQVVVSGLLGQANEPISDFFTMSYISAQVYMIIIGIIGAYSTFPRYVQLGVSRKTTFKGNVLGVLGTAFTLVVFAIILSIIQQGVIGLFNWSVEWEESLIYTILNVTEETGEQTFPFLFGDSALASISRWLVTFVTYWLVIILNYAVGWMIGTAFYSRRFIEKIGTILLGVFFVIVTDMLLGYSIVSILTQLEITTAPMTTWGFGIVGVIINILVLFWLVKRMTRKITIKL